MLAPYCITLSIAVGYVNGHGHHSVQHQAGHHGKHHPSHDNSIVDTKALDNLEDLGANGTLQDDGLVCIDKVMMIQETEYDEVMTCVHKYQERCHSTFRTVYEPHQVIQFLHLEMAHLP